MNIPVIKKGKRTLIFHSQRQAKKLCGLNVVAIFNGTQTKNIKPKVSFTYCE